MKTYTVHFTYKHKGFFWYHETINIDAKNRVDLQQRIFNRVIEREQDDYHMMMVSIDETEETNCSAVS